MAEDVRKVASTAGMAEFERGYEVPRCVVLDSMYCSMGRMVAVRACKAAGWAYHDSVTLLELVPERGVSPQDVEAFEARLAAGDFCAADVRAEGEYQRIAAAFRLAVERALAAGPCLIHDRASKALVEGLGYACVGALCSAYDVPAKRVRAKISPLYEHLSSDAELDAAIAREDLVRARWHELDSNGATSWGAVQTYDLVLNTDLIGRDLAAELLARLMRG